MPICVPPPLASPSLPLAFSVSSVISVVNPAVFPRTTPRPPGRRSHTAWPNPPEPTRFQQSLPTIFSGVWSRFPYRSPRHRAAPFFFLRLLRFFAANHAVDVPPCPPWLGGVPRRFPSRHPMTAEAAVPHRLAWGPSVGEVSACRRGEADAFHRAGCGVIGVICAWLCPMPLPSASWCGFAFEVGRSSVPFVTPRWIPLV